MSRYSPAAITSVNQIRAARNLTNANAFPAIDPTAASTVKIIFHLKKSKIIAFGVVVVLTCLLSAGFIQVYLQTPLMDPDRYQRRRHRISNARNDLSSKNTLSTSTPNLGSPVKPEEVSASDSDEKDLTSDKGGGGGSQDGNQSEYFDTNREAVKFAANRSEFHKLLKRKNQVTISLLPADDRSVNELIDSILKNGTFISIDKSLLSSTSLVSFLKKFLQRSAELFPQFMENFNLGDDASLKVLWNMIQGLNASLRNSLRLQAWRNSFDSLHLHKTGLLLKLRNNTKNDVRYYQDVSCISYIDYPTNFDSALKERFHVAASDSYFLFNISKLIAAYYKHKKSLFSKSDHSDASLIRVLEMIVEAITLFERDTDKEKFGEPYVGFDSEAPLEARVLYAISYYNQLAYNQIIASRIKPQNEVDPQTFAVA